MGSNNHKVAIIGGGSWATALVKIFSDNILARHLANGDGSSISPQINWWMRDVEAIENITKFRRNPNYLSSVELNLDILKITSNLFEVLKDADIVIMAVPAAFLKEALGESKLNRSHFKDKTVVSVIKGIVPIDNLIISEYFNNNFDVPLDSYATISGPCHAEEVAQEKLSYLTVSSEDKEVTKTLTGLLECRYIKTMQSNDVVGIEYAAVLKNIVAIASGICHGVGLGDNFQAVLIANASQEINRFVDKVHPLDRDINNSSYLGDLLVTAYSQFSRNRTLGAMIGKGYSVRSALFEMGMVAEGYNASKCINQINKKYKVAMPICETVFNILYERIAPRVEMRLLSDKLR